MFFNTYEERNLPIFAIPKIEIKKYGKRKKMITHWVRMKKIQAHASCKDVSDLKSGRQRIYNRGSHTQEANTPL